MPDDLAARNRANRGRGKRWERNLRAAFTAAGFRTVKPHQGAAHDEGDLQVSGPFGTVLIQAKDVERLDLSGWVRDAEEQAANAQLDLYAVVAKARGKATDRAYVVLPLHVFLRLLRGGT